MKFQGLTFLLLMSLVTIVISAKKKDKFKPPRLPMFTSIHISTSESNEEAQITVEYLAPEKPFALWFVNGLPIREGRMDFTVVNDFKQRGMTILTSRQDKRSQFKVCLQNVAAEVCLTLRPLPPNAVVRERLHFPWPLIVPGPLVRYEDDEDVEIHAPLLDTPHNYSYSALLISKNPFDRHGRLVIAPTHGMEGGNENDLVTFDPVKDGWMLRIPTNGSHYEGVLFVNTTFVTQEGMAQACSLVQPFSIYWKRHRAAFDEGFVFPVPLSTQWRCRLHVDCMVVCPFVSNGPVSVSVSRMNPVVDELNAERHLVEAGAWGEGEREIEEKVAVTQMLGPYFGYGYVFLPDFVPSEDAGSYKCKYQTVEMAHPIVYLVEVY